MIGHNMPPDPLDEALAPFGDAITEAESWLDGAIVENRGQMDAVDGLTKQIKAAKKAAEAVEESAAKPIYDQWKATKAKFAPTITDLDRIVKGLVAAVSGYKQKLAAEQAAKEREARAEAMRLMAEAEAKSKAAEATDIASVREAADALEAARAATARASAIKADAVKGLRRTEMYEITDHREALHWIAKNDRDAITAFVEEYVRTHFMASKIDGVTTWAERVAV